MEANNLIKELLQNADQLTPGQVDFINSVLRQYKKYKSISDKQLDVLRDIRGGTYIKKVKEIPIISC